MSVVRTIARAAMAFAIGAAFLLLAWVATLGLMAVLGVCLFLVAAWLGIDEWAYRQALRKPEDAK